MVNNRGEFSLSLIIFALRKHKFFVIILLPITSINEGFHGICKIFPRQ